MNVRTVRQVQRFHVLYAPISSFKTVPGGYWRDYYGRSFTYMEACEKATGLEWQFTGYRFEVKHEKLVGGREN